MIVPTRVRRLIRETLASMGGPKRGAAIIGRAYSGVKVWLTGRSWPNNESARRLARHAPGHLESDFVRPRKRKRAI